MTPEETAVMRAAYEQWRKDQVDGGMFRAGWCRGRDYSAPAAAERETALRSVLEQARVQMAILKNIIQCGESWSDLDERSYQRTRAQVLAATAPQQQEEAGGETGGRGEAAALAD